MALFRASTFTKGNLTNYGLSSAFAGSILGSSVYPCHLWGGAVRDDTDTRCVVDQIDAYRGLEWYQQLLLDKVAFNPGWDAADYPLQPGALLDTGSHITSTFMESGSNSITVQITTWRNKFKWTYWPAPRFPSGQATFESPDMYCMSAATSHPEAAWTFLKFLTAEPYWQRYNFRYLLRTPALVDMWDEWVYYVEQAAPAARGKNLVAYKAAAAKYGVCHRYFRYDDTVVEPLLNQALASAMARKTDLLSALRVASAQVDAHEAEAARTAAATLAQAMVVQRLLATASASPTAHFPAPPVAGVGAPATAAPAGAVSVRSGIYTVVGTGAGLLPTGDGFTFACVPSTAVRDSLKGTQVIRETGTTPGGEGGG